MARPSDQALVSDQAATRLDPSGFDPSRGERAAIVAWLRRREGMCREALADLAWYRVFERRYVWLLGGAFKAFALLIERGVHLADSLAAETAILNAAIAANRDSDRSGEAMETAQTGSTEGESAGAAKTAHRPDPVSHLSKIAIDHGEQD